MTTARTARIIMWLPGLESHGGIERHNRALCKAVAAFARDGRATVDIVSLRDEDGLDEPDFLTKPLVGCESHTVRFGLSAVASLASGFDLLVVGVADFGPLVPLARARCPTAPILTMAYGIEVWKALSWPTRAALTQATAVISISKYTADAVVRQHSVGRSRINVIAPPLEPGFIRAAESDVESSVPSRLLSISRLNEIDAPKGVERVIEALPAVRARVPDVDYTIIGSGNDRGRLEDLAVKLRVDSITHFKGSVSDKELHAYLRGTDLFVLPSAKEGFGIVFLEAGAHEKAVVGGAHGGVPEVVLDGVTGVLVRADDVSGLASSITELLNDETLRTRLGRAGASRVREVYGYERFEDRTLSVLETLIPTAKYSRKRALVR